MVVGCKSEPGTGSRPVLTQINPIVDDDAAYSHRPGDWSSSRLHRSFRLLKLRVSAGQAGFCSGFDSGQLHRKGR